jgi:hypothetical protein
MPAGAEFRYRNRAVLATPVDIVAETVYVTSIRVHNRTATSATISIKDKDGTPFEYYEAVPVAGNSIVNERIAAGLSHAPGAAIKFVGGITIQAGTADALTIEVFGWYPGR